MVRHIVMWSLDKVPSEMYDHTVSELREMLLILGDSISSVLHAEVGVQDEDPPLIVLNMDFRTWEDLEAYRVHTEHEAAVKVLRKYTTKLGAVDYEIP